VMLARSRGLARDPFVRSIITGQSTKAAFTVPLCRASGRARQFPHALPSHLPSEPGYAKYRAEIHANERAESHQSRLQQELSNFYFSRWEQRTKVFVCGGHPQNRRGADLSSTGPAQPQCPKAPSVSPRTARDERGLPLLKAIKCTILAPRSPHSDKCQLTPHDAAARSERGTMGG
jgi:hypothetical protein